MAAGAELNRFGEHLAHKLGIEPEVYETTLDIDFTSLRGPDQTAAGFGRAA
ncbi:hypothetical protein AB0B07_31180 [Streptomyces sioyaensis]|uniref:hypothetical protein n=1 Tax=Streptomyces sioyaensis TaxID=67364 RepID=UPI0033C3096C